MKIIEDGWQREATIGGKIQLEKYNCKTTSKVHRRRKSQGQTRVDKATLGVIAGIREGT